MAWDIAQMILATLITAFIGWILIAGIIANARMRAERIARKAHDAATPAKSKKSVARNTVSNS